MVYFENVNLVYRNVHSGEIIERFSLPANRIYMMDINTNFAVIKNSRELLVYHSDSRDEVSTFSISSSCLEGENEITKLSCDDKKIAVSLQRGFPIILHFDEVDHPAVKFVQLTPWSTTQQHSATPHNLYDTIANLMRGNLQNIEQFIIDYDSHQPELATSRIYMVTTIGIIGSDMGYLYSNTNPAATMFLRGVRAHESHPNVLWPIFRQHTVPAPMQSGNLEEFEARGHAFLFEETRVGIDQPWVLTDLHELDIDHKVRHLDNFANFTFDQ